MVTDKNSKKKNVWYYDVAKNDDSCDCGGTPVDPSTVINDDVTSTGKTWSSAKIMAEILKAASGNLNVDYDGQSANEVNNSDVEFDGGSSTDYPGGNVNP